MSRQHEGQSDGIVLASEDPPGQILHGGIIFVLTDAIVCMQVHFFALLSPFLKKVMKETNGCIGSLSNYICFIYEVVHLPSKWLTCHTKYLALPSSQKVGRSWLQWVVGKVHLLRKIIRVVHWYIFPNSWRVVGLAICGDLLVVLCSKFCFLCQGKVISVVGQSGCLFII